MNDQMGDNNFDLLKYLRNLTSNCSSENNFCCGPLCDTPHEYVDSYGGMSHDLLDASAGKCHILRIEVMNI